MIRKTRMTVWELLGKTVVDHDTECLVWQGYIDKEGYAQALEIRMGGQRFKERQALAEKYGIGRNHVCSIQRGTRWRG